MSRIKLHMSGQDIVLVMAEGNPGAMRVLCELLVEGPRIDPDDFLGGIGPVLFLDTLRIYSSRIWMLYSDVCECDLVKMSGLLRAVQLGKLSEGELNHGIDNRGDGLDIDAALRLVRAELPRFAPATTCDAVQS